MLPCKAEPLNIFFNAFNVFGFFRYGVGIVEPKVGITRIFLGKAEIQADTAGMADVEIPVGFGWKTGYNAFVSAGFKIVFNNFFQEVQAPFFFFYVFAHSRQS